MAVYTNIEKYTSPLTTNGDMLTRDSGSDVRLPITAGNYFTAIAGGPSWETWTPGGGSGGYTHGLKTRVQIAAIVSPAAGDTVFCTDLAKQCVYTGNSWQVPGETVEVLNVIGSTPVFGEVVITSPTAYYSALYTNQDADLRVLGPVVFPASSGNYMSVAIKGDWPVMFYVGSITAGRFIQTDGGNQGGAKDQTTTSDGAFGIVKQSGGSGLLDCSLFTVELL